MTGYSRGGYPGGKPASEMGPPAQVPSGTIRPRPLSGEKDAEIERFHDEWQKAAQAQLDAMAQLETVRAERDKAREECGHEKAMRAYLSEELSGWIKRASEARGAMARVEALCNEATQRATLRTGDPSVSARELRAALRGQPSTACFCGTPLDQHPPGPPCPPPPPPGVSHG